MTEKIDVTQAANELHDLIGEVYRRGYSDALEDATVDEDWYSEEAAEGCAQVQADFADRLAALSRPSTPTRELTEAVEAEREACAKVAEEDRRTSAARELGYEPEWFKHGKRIATAIRARTTLHRGDEG